MNKWFRKGLRHGAAVAVGYLSVALPFGMVCADMGLTPVQAMLLSLTNLTSAGQFAGLPLMLAQAGMIEVILTQLVINLRYGLMGLSLTPKLAGDMTTPHRMLFAFGNTDEVFAIASAQPEKLNHHYLYGLAVLPWLGWGIGSYLGALAGALMPPAVSNCLAMAMYAMFLAIMLPPARACRPVMLVVAVSAAISVVLHVLPWQMSAGFSVIVCAVVAAGLGAWLFPLQEKGGASP